MAYNSDITSLYSYSRLNNGATGRDFAVRHSVGWRTMALAATTKNHKAQESSSDLLSCALCRYRQNNHELLFQPDEDIFRQLLI